MFKKIETPIFVLLLLFVLYCAIITGSSWDELYEMNIGKDRLKYLLSFGSYQYFDFHIITERYPAFYNTIAIFITKIFPKKYEVEAWRLINSTFTILSIFGIYNITKILFNKKVAKIVFLICFLNPIYFGHMAINSKDTIFAFANIWSTYIFLRYIKKQHFSVYRNRYIILAGLSIGLGTGVRLPFLITLLPLVIFLVFEIIYFKSIISNKFSVKKFILDLVIILFIAYLITISTWPQVHSNIFLEPFKILMTGVDLQDFGSQWILFNQNFFDTLMLPSSYIIINLIYKSPEFLLLLYIIFIYLIIVKKDFFASKFKFFWKKIFIILLIFLFPLLYFSFLPYRIYDGLRLFLYIIPYFCIIPGLAIYYLFNNKNLFLEKILIGITTFLFVYYSYYFIVLTPYQYTYLNFLSGNSQNKIQKFENDYWGISIKELIKQIPEKTNLVSESKNIKLALCGVNHEVVISELDKLKNLKYEIKDLYDGDFDYIIMTNRAVGNKNTNNVSEVKTCFQKIEGEDLISVKRIDLILSTLRKKL